MTAPGDHPYTDPGDGRTECPTCGKWIHQVTHSCKRIPVTEAARQRMAARQHRHHPKGPGMTQQPFVGSIVHYVSYGTPGGEYPSVCRAAIITEVGGEAAYGRVSLAVLNPEGMFFNRDSSYAEDRRGGTWHWRDELGLTVLQCADGDF